MKWILKLLLTAVVVVILAKVLPGVEVASYGYAILVALVIGILKVIVRPILILLSGFSVANIWWALLFSLLLSILQSFLHKMIKDEK